MLASIVMAIPFALFARWLFRRTMVRTVIAFGASFLAFSLILNVSAAIYVLVTVPK